MNAPDRFATLRDVASLTRFVDERLASAKKTLDALTASRAPRSVETVLMPLDRISMDLDLAGNAGSFLRHVHPDPAMRTASEQCEQKVSAFATDLSLNRGIYEAVAGARDASTPFAKEVAGADRGTKHLVERTLRDFRRAGVDRDEATRNRVKSLQEELVKIGQEFSANIAKDTRAVEVDPKFLEALPADWLRAHSPQPNGKIRVTTDYPDYVPVMSYCTDGATRKALYLAFRQRATPHNLDVLKRLLTKRHELATLLGYKSWAAFITEDKMIGSDVKAADFIEKIATAAEARMKADYAMLFAQQRDDEPGATVVHDYDRAYVEERVKKVKFAFDSQSVRPYFEYGRVKQGLFDVTSTMFGVKYSRASAAAWHPEVEVWDVADAKTGAALGRFYLDMHPREGKFKHAAMFPVVSGVAGVQTPEAALVCNFPAAHGSDPALMEYSDVRTFFHEFGHLIHHLLGGHQRWASNSGIRTEWDFVEAPSQMLEEWCSDYDTLKSFAVHHQTGETIPREMVERLRRAEEFGNGLQVRHQMFYAMLSLSLYRSDPKDIDTTALARELQNRYSAFTFVEGSVWEASFGHLDDYSAIYYTYMWSLVIAKDLFGEFKKKGLLHPEVSGKYREMILAPGGSAPAAELVHDFLGREVGFGAYEAWLNEGAA